MPVRTSKQQAEQPARRRGRRLVALASAVAIGVTGVVAGPIAAHADDYPTWDDVLAARSSADGAQAAVDQINALLAQLAAEVERTQKDLEAKSKRWQELNLQVQQKQTETATLREQAQEAESIALESEARAGQWAVQTVRIGGSDPTLSLFAASDDAGELLSAIGVSSRISSQANDVYEQALQQRNTAQSLTDQAAVMEEELERLEVDAQTAMEEAQVASEAATQAKLEQEQHRAVLEAQLAVVRGELAYTEEQYQIGEQKRLEEQLANLGVDWAQVSPSGWVRPAGGYISSDYGWREEGWHDGVDLAQGCWNPIIAAHSGTVTRASWYGGYGYAIDIDHGGGLWTRYGHMPEGGFTVSYGQSVSTGQQIGHVGTTGNSTGCHLHFEVHTPYGSTDPVAFLAAQGIYI